MSALPLGITRERLDKARVAVNNSPLVKNIPLLKNVEELFSLDVNCNVHLKLETLQKTGSFKARGLANQLANLPPSVIKENKSLVAMSSGNYGRAIACAAQLMGLPATVVLPDVAPINRVKILEGYGASVERAPSSELRKRIKEHVEKDGMHFLHSFDDADVICGCASAGYEILEEIPEPDVIIACCGGGGLLGGVSVAMKCFGKKTRVFGVESEGAPKYFKSLQAGEPLTLDKIDTIATGLAPPFAGINNFEVIKHCVEEIILVSDEEIRRAMRVLFSNGLVVEPSGAAAFAAFLSKKVPGIEAGANVVIFLTGANASLEEMNKFIGHSNV